jgi:hypothetical protein
MPVALKQIDGNSRTAWTMSSAEVRDDRAHPFSIVELRVCNAAPRTLSR